MESIFIDNKETEYFVGRDHFASRAFFRNQSEKITIQFRTQSRLQVLST